MKAIMIIHHFHAAPIYQFFEQIFTEHLQGAGSEQAGFRGKTWPGSGYSGLHLLSPNIYQQMFFEVEVSVCFFLNC